MFNDGQEKKKKQEYYEQKKAELDTKDCTFKPGRDVIGQSKHISVKLYSNKDGVQMKTAKATNQRNETIKAKKLDTNSTQNLESMNATENSMMRKTNNSEFFDYLAYHGVKN